MRCNVWMSSKTGLSGLQRAASSARVLYSAVHCADVCCCGVKAKQKDSACHCCSEVQVCHGATVCPAMLLTVRRQQPHCHCISSASRCGWQTVDCFGSATYVARYIHCSAAFRAAGSAVKLLVLTFTGCIELLYVCGGCLQTEGQFQLVFCSLLGS